MAAFPTKWNPSGGRAKSQPIKLTLRNDKARIRQITIGDVGSFAKSKTISAMGHLPTSISEKEFKEGVARIANEVGRFVDWGGETNDLFTTQLVLSGRRRSVAFGFKGPGTKGKLTPGKMGKNGDQIQRLFESPAEVFIVQYWGEIDQSVLKQMETHAIARSIYTGQEVFFGVINGVDSYRLFRAYKSKFGSTGAKK